MDAKAIIDNGDKIQLFAKMFAFRGVNARREKRVQALYGRGRARSRRKRLGRYCRPCTDAQLPASTPSPTSSSYSELNIVEAAKAAAMT